MFHEKDKYYINGSSDDFRIIGTEKDQHLIRLREKCEKCGYLYRFEPRTKISRKQNFKTFEF